MYYEGYFWIPCYSESVPPNEKFPEVFQYVHTHLPCKTIKELNKSSIITWGCTLLMLEGFYKVLQQSTG